MYRGTLILESLKVGSTLTNLPLLVHKLTRQPVSNTSPDQPPVWTLLEFEVGDDHAVALSEARTHGRSLAIPEPQLDWTD